MQKAKIKSCLPMKRRLMSFKLSEAIEAYRLTEDRQCERSQLTSAQSSSTRDNLDSFKLRIGHNYINSLTEEADRENDDM